MDKRVCLPISGSCNNNCIFCMDDWGVSKFVSIEEITKKLKTSKIYYDEVSFCSLEPTLHPKLDEICSISRNLGFKKIEVVTNGLKLNNYSYTEKLINSGVNQFNISLHSHLPFRHDKIVRVPGSFKYVIKALKNLMVLNTYYDIKVDVSMTVCKENYKDIYNFIVFIEKFNPSNIILNMLQPKNEAEKNKEITFVTYTSIISEISNSKHLFSYYNNIYLNGLVPCLTHNLQDYIGYYNGAQIEKKDKYGNYILEFNSFKEKREECKYCKYDNYCEGVWQSYIDKFGREEFRPIEN